MSFGQGQITDWTLRFESNPVAAPYGVGPQGIANRDGTASVKFSGTAVNVVSTAVNYGVNGSGTDVTLYGDTAGAYAMWDQSADALIRAGAAVDLYTQAGGSTGVVVDVIGPDLTHGMKTVVVSGTVVPAAVETTLFTLPAISRLVAVQANCDAALTGGGTTVTWGIGVTGDVDTFGTVFAAGTQADALTKNSKVNAIGTPASPPQPGSGVGQFFASATAVKLIGAATGGASAGNTALTVGSVSFRIIYQTLMPLADAP